MKKGFYAGMILGTLSTVLVLKKEKVSKFMEKARNK